MPEKFQSLADFLGTADEPEPDGPSVDAAWRGPMSAKQFCEAVLNSIEFRKYIVSGIAMRDLPPGILTRIMDQGWGKPPDRVEFKDVTADVDEMDIEQCEQEAMRLLEIARQLKQSNGLVH